jgi:hypothetical protein
MPIVKRGTFRDPRGDFFLLPARLDLHVGLDGGNTLTKVWVRFADGTESSFVMPSLVAPGSWSDLVEMRAGTRKTQTAAEKDIVISYGGIEYFAGALAAAQLQEASTGRGDALRYASPEALLRCLAAVGAVVEEYEAELEQERSRSGSPALRSAEAPAFFPVIHLSVCSSVPVRYYTQANRRAIRTRFLGTHECVVNGKTRTFHLSYQETIMEGGGLEILAAELPGNDLAAPSDTVILDGGGDTVDFVRLSAEDVLYEQCGTIRCGVERIGDLLSTFMQRDYHRPLSSRERQALLDGFVRFRDQGRLETAYPVLAIDPSERRSVPKEQLHRWVEVARRQVARQVISKASALWGATHGKVAPDVLRGHAFFIGGATYLLDDLITAAMPQLLIPPQPELANARANAAIAQALAEGAACAQ